ncbi:fungal specific transcription factor domain-containing protein [Stemphylium lycopersici]|nr:fungal specific transcription factor domain-containing protein [Stemphylium lycopersici]
MSESRLTPTPSNPEVDAHISQGSADVSGIDYLEHLETEALDLLDEDLHTRDEARSIGFVGKSSEIQWLRAVALAQAERADMNWDGSSLSRRPSYVPIREPVSSFSFWADREDVSVDFYVDPHAMPPPEVAEHLVQCYMLKVHASFPILSRKEFTDQTRIYFGSLRNGNAPHLNPKWQAILNLVFAIGANYAQLLDDRWPAVDHVTYQARARAFGLSEAAVTSHPDVPQIQSLGLLGFYWLSTGQVSRAWSIVGIALRSAFSLGLHVRNEDPSANATKRESLVQTWWSLYSLERTLSIITGRPSTVVDSCCSVPLPMTMPEEAIPEGVRTAYMHTGKAPAAHSATFSASSSMTANPPLTPFHPVTASASPGTYFRAVVQLSIITQSVLMSLYSAGTMIRSLNDIQQDTTLLSQRLDQWVSSLLPEFRPEDDASDLGNMFARERMLLKFQLCSARILLARPFLTTRRQPLKNSHDATFSRNMSDSCIKAACTIVVSFPDEFSVHVYEHLPWWCLIHHVMQATSVLLLGLSYPSSTSYNASALVHHVRKAVSWLQMMQGSVAECAHRVALNSFENVARQYAVDVSDLWGLREASIVRDLRLDHHLSAAVAKASTTMPGVSAYGTHSTSIDVTHSSDSQPPMFHETHMSG